MKIDNGSRQLTIFFLLKELLDTPTQLEVTFECEVPWSRLSEDSQEKILKEALKIALIYANDKDYRLVFKGKFRIDRIVFDKLF